MKLLRIGGQLKFMIKQLSKTKISMPKAVIFDTDNTLYPYGPAHKEAINAVYKKMEDLLGIGVKDIEAVLIEAKKEIKKQLGETASSHSRLLYFQRMLEKLDLKTRISLALDLEQTYWRTFLVNAHLFDGVLEMLQTLKSNGIITANITDLTAQIQFRKMVYFNLDSYFDFVVTSEESGMDKPHSNSFELAFKKLEVDPSEAWMIGDHYINDMQGAKSFGVTTFFAKHLYSDSSNCNTENTDFIFDSFLSLRDFFHNLTK